MDDEVKLGVEVLDAGASPAIAGFEARLTALEASFVKTKIAADTTNLSLTNFGTTATQLGGSLGQLGVAGSDAFGLIGQKAAGLSGIFKAIPGPIMACVAAVAALVAIGMELNAAASAAGNYQTKMAQLANEVKDQGGNWSKTKDSVDAFLTTLEKTTTYSKTEGLSAIQSLTSAGIGLKDSEHLVAVASDVAAAKHKSLEQITNTLKMAESGRMMGLQRLDVHLKDMISRHASFNDVLNKLAFDMRGSAAAALDTYEGSQKRLKDAFETLQVTIGNGMLPMLTKLTQGFTSLVENVQVQFLKFQKAGETWYLRNKEFIDDLGKVFAGLGAVVRVAFDLVLGIVKATFGVMADDFTFVGDLLTGHWGKLWGDIKKTGYDAWVTLEGMFGNFGDNLIKIAMRIGERIGHFFHGLWSGMTGDFAGAGNEMAKAFGGGLTDGLKKWTMGKDAVSGVTDVFTGAASAGLSAYEQGTVTQQSQLHKPHASGAHSAAAAAIKAATLAHKEYETQIQHEIKTIEDHAQKTIQGIKNEIATLKLLEIEANLTFAQREAIDNKIKSLGAEEVKLVAAAEKEKQRLQAETFNKLKKALDASVTHAKDTWGIHSQQYINALLYEQHYLELWLQKHKNADQKLIDSAHARLDAITASEDTYYTWVQTQLDKQEAAYQKHYDATLKLAGSWADKTLGYIDKIGQKGKTVWQSIGDDFKQMISDMEHALLRSMLVKLFFPTAAGATGLPGGFPAGGGATGGAGGILGVLSGLAGAGGSAGGSVSAGGAGGILGAIGAASGAGAGGGGGISGLISGVSSPGLIGAAGSAGGIGGGIGSGGGLGGALGGGFGAMLGGAGLGVMLGKATGGGVLGGFLGAAGAFAGLSMFAGTGLFSGAMALGPLGIGLIAISALLGSGLLGGHGGNPHDSPDRHNTQNWGQGLADLQGSGTHGLGAMHANGHSFTMDAATATATNGRGWNILIESFIQMYKNKQSVLSPKLKSAFPRLQALWGGASAQAAFNKGSKNGMLEIGSGAKAYYTEFLDQINTNGAEIAAMMSGGANVYSTSNTQQSEGYYQPSSSFAGIAHAMPDFMGAMGGSGAGFGGTVVNPGLTGALSGATSGGGRGGGGGGGMNITFNGTVIHENDIIARISQAVAASMRGLGSASRMMTTIGTT